MAVKIILRHCLTVMAALEIRSKKAAMIATVMSLADSGVVYELFDGGWLWLDDAFLVRDIVDLYHGRGAFEDL